MLLTGLVCPIDSLALAPVAFNELTRGVVQPRGRGDHLHIEADNAEVTCLNGHTWLVAGGFTMERR